MGWLWRWWYPQRRGSSSGGITRSGSGDGSGGIVRSDSGGGK